MPIWVADYALWAYGTGIVKCSAHDERDFRFAKKYDIKLKPVLFPADEKEAEKVRNLEGVAINDMKNDDGRSALKLLAAKKSSLNTRKITAGRSRRLIIKSATG